MKILVIGASGATGKHLVNQLLEMGREVKIIIRESSQIPSKWNSDANLEIIRTELSNIKIEEMSSIVSDCDSVASCLGHNVSRKGMWGKPRRLVKDAVSLVYESIKANKPEKPVKFVLMSTVAVTNSIINEKRATGETIVFGILRYLLPPHTDNEQSAKYVSEYIGTNDNFLEWSAVRPDTLLNDETISPYESFESLQTSIFKPGKTSRINCANFMATLIESDEEWQKWKFKMPVVYNK